METRNYFYMFKKYKTNNLMSRILFSYSLIGLIVMDFIEFLTSWKAVKFTKFRASVGSSVNLMWKASK
jgi:hypothetical protein